MPATQRHGEAKIEQFATSPPIFCSLEVGLEARNRADCVFPHRLGRAGAQEEGKPRPPRNLLKITCAGLARTAPHDEPRRAGASLLQDC